MFFIPLQQGIVLEAVLLTTDYDESMATSKCDHNNWYVCTNYDRQLPYWWKISVTFLSLPTPSRPRRSFLSHPSLLPPASALFSSALGDACRSLVAEAQSWQTGQKKSAQRNTQRFSSRFGTIHAVVFVRRTHQHVRLFLCVMYIVGA